MKYRIAAFTGLAACLFAGAAGAAGTSSATYSGSDPVYGNRGMQGPLSQVMNRLDHNADNVVSKTEARQHTWFSDRHFTAFDKDMNGELDNVEIETAGAASLTDSG